MDHQQRQKLMRYVRYLPGSIMSYLIFAICSSLIHLTVQYGNYDTRGQYYFLPFSVVFAAGFVLSLLFYQSLIRTATVCNDPVRARFRAIWDRDNPPGFLRRLNFILRSPEFLSDLILHSFLLLILPSAFGHSALVSLLGKSAGKGLILLILIPSLALLSLVARLSALSAWSVEWGRRTHVPELEKTPIRKPILRVLLIAGLFPVVGVMTPIAIRAIYSLYQILRLVNPWILIPVILGAVLLWYLIRFLIAAGKRSRFLRRLRTFCSANGYELTDVKNCLRTLIFPRAGYNFSMQKGSTRYDCRLLSSMGRHSPLLLREEGTVTCTHVLRLFALNLFHFDFTYEYQFEGAGKKVLILLPEPIEVFVSGYGVTQPAAPGSRIADCVIYGAPEFLNALERNVVGKSGND